MKTTVILNKMPYPYHLMPNSLAGFVRDFDFCECSWKDCAAIQEKIVHHCVESEANDAALGFVKITATDSNNRLRGCIKRLLSYHPKNGKQDSDYIVLHAITGITRGP